MKNVIRKILRKYSAQSGNLTHTEEAQDYHRKLEALHFKRVNPFARLGKELHKTTPSDTSFDLK
ncbi:MAG: hypothetical protein ACMUJM_18205 [bacterium]